MMSKSELNIDELKAAALKATACDLDTAQIIRDEDLVSECPFCSGDGSVQVEKDYCNIDGFAVGVNFYGIGNEHGANEAYFRLASPKNIISLVDRIKTADHAIYERDEIIDQLRQKYQREHIDTNRWKNRADLAEAQIELANAQEPLGFVFPDDFEKLGNSECAADIYSVEQGHPYRGVTLPVYAARPTPTKSHDVEREELIRLIEAVRKWGIDYTGCEPSISCFHQAVDNLRMALDNPPAIPAQQLQSVYVAPVATGDGSGTDENNCADFSDFMGKQQWPAVAVPDDKHILFLAEKFMPSTYLATENKAILWFAKACIDAAQPMQQPVIFEPSPGIDFEDLQRKKNDPFHRAVSNWYARLTYCDAVADEGEHVGYCCPLKMMSELEEILAAPVPKQEPFAILCHQPADGIFEADTVFSHMPIIPGGERHLQLEQSKNWVCIPVYRDPVPAQAENPLVDAVFAASDRKAADTFGKCPRCSHECVQPNWNVVANEDWNIPKIGQRVILRINGAVQNDSFTLDQADGEPGCGYYFWSRDDLDDCPEVKAGDMWMPWPESVGD